MCATGVYYYFDAPIDIDQYHSLLSDHFNVTGKSRDVILVHFHENKTVELEYWGDDDPAVTYSDILIEMLDEKPQFVEPAMLNQLHSWHAENFSVVLDHVVGTSNPYFEEIQRLMSENVT